MFNQVQKNQSHFRYTCFKNYQDVSFYIHFDFFFFQKQFGNLLNLNYELHVHGVEVQDIIKKLKFNPKSFSALIQTDKSKYKPNDLVKFRIILIKSNTKPLDVHKELTVHILDPNGNILQKWDHESTFRGVFKNIFKLSKFPSLDKYQIKVEFKNQVIFSNAYPNF
jgi:uncharacterized protein YfaS (alpha-2-macroglobulin family)